MMAAANAGYMAKEWQVEGPSRRKQFKQIPTKE